MFGCKRRDAVSLLFALCKKEGYEAEGYHAFVHYGIFSDDGAYEVYAFPKPKRVPTASTPAFTLRTGPTRTSLSTSRDSKET